MIEMPKRIQPPAPLGSMLKRFDAPERVQKVDGEKQPDYLAMIRQLPCLYCGHDVSEAAHVRYASAAFGKASGLGKKPEDKFAVPLCAQDHRLATHAQHNRNEEAFWIGIGINPLLVAQKLWERRFDFPAMHMVCVEAIANRDKK